MSSVAQYAQDSMLFDPGESTSGDLYHMADSEVTVTGFDRAINETTFHVRYAETDRMGVVHHAVYLVWFEEGRSAFIRERGWNYADIERSGYFLAASKLNAKYFRAARYDQRVTVRTWIASYRSRTITCACEVTDADNEESLFVATIRLICLNGDGAIVRIPKAWSRWLDS